MTPPPNDFEGGDEEWMSMTPYQRWYFQNKESEIKRTRKQREDKRDWFEHLKCDLECQRCGFDGHPAAIDFHHPDEDGDQRMSPSEMVHRNYSREKVLEEIQTLIPLCANCHRIEHN
jgi:5-methylcytosine-specific restriction endonuclease McrA